jgi:hypothetical protein
MPEDRRAFAQRVFTLLGGEPQSAKPNYRDNADAAIEWERRWADFISLANDALGYVQSWEARGQPPAKLKEMTNPSRFERVCRIVADDPDVALQRFGKVVQQAVREIGTAQPNRGACIAQGKRAPGWSRLR